MKEWLCTKREQKGHRERERTNHAFIVITVRNAWKGVSATAVPHRKWERAGKRDEEVTKDEGEKRGPL